MFQQTKIIERIKQAFSPSKPVVNTGNHKASGGHAHGHSHEGCCGGHCGCNHEHKA